MTLSARACSAAVGALLAAGACGGSTVESPDGHRDADAHQDASPSLLDSGGVRHAHDARVLSELDAREASDASDDGPVNCANPHPVVTCGHPCSVPGYTCNPDPSGSARTDAGPDSPVLSWTCSASDGGGYVWVCFT